MSNELFQSVSAGIVLAQAAALIWAVIPRGDRRALLVLNMLLSAGVLIVLLPQLPAEIGYLSSAATTDFLEYKTLLLCAVEFAVLVPAGMALCSVRVPTALIWLGFAINFCFSIMAMIFAFTFEFRCCGYL